MIFNNPGKTENFAQNDHQHHTVPNTSLLHHVNNQPPVSTVLGLIGGRKKHSTIEMLKKTNSPLDAKKRCNTKRYDTAIPIL